MSETWTDSWGRVWTLTAPAPEPAAQEPPAPEPAGDPAVQSSGGTLVVPDGADVPGAFPEAAPAYAQSLHPDDAVASVSAAGHRAGGHDGLGAGVSN